MNDKFSPLSNEEFKKLAETPLYVSLLIAASDSEIEAKELEWAEKVTHFRIKTAHHTIRNYYKAANEFIHDNMKLVVSNLPENQEEKMTILANKVTECNDILAKLDTRTQDKLIESYKSLALSVAEISGGLMNFFSTNPAEAKWLELDMIHHS